MAPVLEPGLYTLLQYDYVDNMLERRTPFREAHLAWAKAAKQRAELLVAGAVGDAESALFVFAPDGTDAAHSFVAGDPYVINDLVPTWRITTWSVVA